MIWVLSILLGSLAHVTTSFPTTTTTTNGTTGVSISPSSFCNNVSHSSHVVNVNQTSGCETGPISRTVPPQNGGKGGEGEEKSPLSKTTTLVRLGFWNTHFKNGTKMPDCVGWTEILWDAGITCAAFDWS